MKDSGIIAYWIERATGRLENHVLGKDHLRPGGSWSWEIETKYAVDPIDLVIIPLSDVGSEWAKMTVGRLRMKSEQMVAEIGAHQDLGRGGEIA